MNRLEKAGSGQGEQLPTHPSHTTIRTGPYEGLLVDNYLTLLAAAPKR